MEGRSNGDVQNSMCKKDQYPVSSHGGRFTHELYLVKSKFALTESGRKDHIMTNQCRDFKFMRKREIPNDLCF